MERPLEVFLDSEINPDAIMAIEQIESPIAVCSVLSNSMLISGGMHILPSEVSFERSNEYGNTYTVQGMIIESDFNHIQLATLLSSNLICHVDSVADLAPLANM